MDPRRIPGGPGPRGRTEKAFLEFAEAYDALLRKEHWAEGRISGSYYFGRGLDLPKGAEDHPLISLARTHWQAALEVVRRTPTHDVAWEVLGQLARWHPDHPRLADLIVDIPMTPSGAYWGGEDWPSHSAIETACDQLKHLKDWAGLERFALDRLGRIRGAGETYHPDLANDWSGVTSFSSTEEISKPTRKERDGERIGKWLLVLLNAQLHQGKSMEAQETRRRIDREGNTQSQSRADHLIRERAQPSRNPEELDD